MARVDENETNNIGNKCPWPRIPLRALVPRRERTLLVAQEGFIPGFQLVTAEHKCIKLTLLSAQGTITDGFNALERSVSRHEPLLARTLECRVGTH